MNTAKNFSVNLPTRSKTNENAPTPLRNQQQLADLRDELNDIIAKTTSNPTHSQSGSHLDKAVNKLLDAIEEKIVELETYAETETQILEKACQGLMVMQDRAKLLPEKL